MADAIAISPEGRSWAVQHNGGYLGYADTKDQALAIANDLATWLRGQGRSPDLVVRDTSAPAPYANAVPH
jgi:hypothetical protein